MKISIGSKVEEYLTFSTADGKSVYPAFVTVLLFFFVS
jgi:hypothetical protein